MGPPLPEHPRRARARDPSPRSPGRLMSIDSVLARMNALQALMDSASGAVAPASDNTAAFSQAMTAATTDSGSSNANANLATLASPIGTATIRGVTGATATGGASALPAGTPYGA